MKALSDRFGASVILALIFTALSPGPVYAWKIKVGDKEYKGKDPGKVVAEAVPQAREVINKGLDAAGEAAKDVKAIVDKGVKEAQEVTKAAVQKTLDLANKSIVETKTFNREVLSCITDVKKRLIAKELTSVQVREVLPQLLRAVNANQEVIVANATALRGQLKEAKDSKISAAVIGIAIKSLSDPLNQLNQEQLTELAQGIIKKIPVNELLETKILGGLRIIDLSIQGAYERLDKTEIQKCIRTHLIESVKEKVPANNEELKLRIVKITADCVTQKLSKKVPQSDVGRDSTSGQNAGTPPVKGEDPLVDQTVAELTKLEDAMKRLDEANKITEGVKETVGILQTTASTPPTPK